MKKQISKNTKQNNNYDDKKDQEEEKSIIPIMKQNTEEEEKSIIPIQNQIPKQPRKSIYGRKQEHNFVILESNHLMIRIKNQGLIYSYFIDFGPHIQDKDKETKKEAIKNIQVDLKNLIGNFFLIGNNIFSQVKEENPIHIKSSALGTNHNLTFTLSDTIDMNELEKDKNYSDVQKYLNKILKNGLIENKFFQIGKSPKFFLPEERQKTQVQCIDMWPGYTLQAKWLNDGIFLNIDTATKFINSKTIYSNINAFLQQGYSKQSLIEYYSPQGQDKKRFVVITSHNYKQYQVDSLTFDITPANHYFEWKTKKNIIMRTNMVDYFLMHHKTDLKNVQNQPMMVVNQRDGYIYLPTSLCHQASLPNDIIENRYEMKKLQDSKISDPEDRFRRIQKMFPKLSSNSFFDEWNLEIKNQFTNVKAKVLDPPLVQDNKGKYVDWDQYQFGKLKNIEPMSLSFKQWGLVYSDNDFDLVNDLIYSFQQAQTKIGMKVEEPIWVNTAEKGSFSQLSIKEINTKIDPKPVYFVMVILKRKEDKKDIKGHLDKMGIASQFILVNTAQRSLQKMGVLSNILKQVNAKSRLDLYRLKIPLEQAMVIGIDVINEGSKSIIGFTSSYTKSFTQFFSTTAIQGLHKEVIREQGKDAQEKLITEERTSIIGDFMKQALKVYQKFNEGNLPMNVLLYRDGIGGPSMLNKVSQYEIQEIIQTIQGYAKSYQPKILYCFVDKKISHRLFAKDSYNNHINPGPGTVVDTGLVECQGDTLFDFYMIPHNATIATALPVHYKIVFNSTDLLKDDIETLTYHQCYGYVNFCGSIKVPAAVMYAHKLCNYVHENKISPNKRLGVSLHFL